MAHVFPLSTEEPPCEPAPSSLCFSEMVTLPCSQLGEGWLSICRPLRARRQVSRQQSCLRGRKKLAHISQRDQVAVVPAQALNHSVVEIRLRGAFQAGLTQPLGETLDTFVEVL